MTREFAKRGINCDCDLDRDLAWFTGGPAQHG